jgi:nicotinamide riboside kinase
MTRHILVALLGAESTGKSTVAGLLAPALASKTAQVWVVAPEYLREWCEANGRTPQQHEQAHIAQTQAHRIDMALKTANVIADTTPWMTALYSGHYFSDSSLWPFALEFEKKSDLRLLTMPDTPWLPDGFLRDGPQTRAAIHAEILAKLHAQNLAFSGLPGSLEQRLTVAVDTVEIAWNKVGISVKSVK